MIQLHDRPLTTSTQREPAEGPRGRGPTPLSLRQVNLLRVGYLVMGRGLAIKKWPLLFDHEPWGLMEGIVQIMLVAMSVLALLGLRYPVRMLPILLFEVAWKLIWIGTVGIPHLVSGDMDAAAREVLFNCSFVVVIIAVIPWRYAWRRYVRTPGDAWR